jgi:hypothetical protein
MMATFDSVRAEFWKLMWKLDCPLIAAEFRLLEERSLREQITDQTFAGSRSQSHQQHYQWETRYARVR